MNKEMNDKLMLCLLYCKEQIESSGGEILEEVDISEIASIIEYIGKNKI